MFLKTDPSRPQHRAMEYDAEKATIRLARHMNAGLAGNGRDPFVIGQLGQSLDGRIATPTGHSKYINGREALRHLHMIRAMVDAVVVGVGTAIADDPQLTTRHVEGPNPARVVIDPNGRLPRDLTMLRDAAAPVIVITSPGAPVPEGAEALALPCGETVNGTAHIPPETIVRALAGRGLGRVLVEGGAETLARFLDAGTLNELHLMIAPIVLGSGTTGINLAPIGTVGEALRPDVRTMRFKDGDMLCMCDMMPPQDELARGDSEREIRECNRTATA